MMLKFKNLNKVCSIEKNLILVGISFSEALKAHEDIETLREQYDNSVTEYDKLNEEHRKLQVD